MATMAKTTKTRRLRRQFDDEFKAGAVRLVLDEQQTVGRVARDLNLTESALRHWVERARIEGRQQKPQGRRAYPRPYTVPLTQVLPVIDLRVAFLDERSRAGLAGERRHAVCLRVAFNAGDRMDQFSCRTGV